MRMYEFKCAECGRQFEELVVGDEKPACPACGSTKTEKVLSACRAKMGAMTNDFPPPPTDLSQFRS